MVNPTPTQAENDAERTAHVFDHAYDGSAFQPGPQNIGAVPTLSTIAPATGAHPISALAVACTGTGFTVDSVVLFDGVAQPTTYNSPTQVTATVSYSGGAASKNVVVRGVKGDSAPQVFTVT